MTMQRQPTIHDVAASSGLSRGTVSRYLNGGKNVSPGAARAIERAIAESGYRVNKVARSLRSSRTDCVAFVLTQPMDVLFSDPVHAVIARACNEALARRDLSMVMVMAGSKAERERAKSYLLSGSVDGIFVVGSGEDQAQNLSPLAELGLPMVVCSHREDGLPACTVSSDSVQAFSETVDMLRQRGRRRIAFLGGTSALDETPLRLQGYLRGMGEGADPLLVAVPRQGFAPAEQSVRELADRTQFDALVCSNDVAAIHALQELTRLGVSVPHDVAVVGFDNVEELCTSTTPQLTSVAQDFPAIAEQMVTLLGHAPTHVNVPTRIVHRQST